MLSVHTNYASLVSQNSVTKNNDLTKQRYGASIDWSTYQ